MQSSKLLASLVCFIPLLSSAQTLPNHFPKALIFQNQPINPLCFYLSETSSQVSLNDCTKRAQANIKVTGHNEHLSEQGFVGFDYAGHGYSYYKIVGSFNGLYTIYTINSGGGSGDFTSLFLVKRDKDVIELTALASGDRCNGGIAAVSQNGHSLHYDVQLTPYDFLAVTAQNPHKLRAYEDLAACAACCAALAHYELNVNGPKEALLNTVGFDPEITPPDSKTAYQECFDKQMNQYRQAGKTNLSVVALKKFVTTFNQNCTNT